METKNAQHTVIIPSYNTLGHLKNTYQSIKKYAPNVVEGTHKLVEWSKTL